MSRRSHEQLPIVHPLERDSDVVLLVAVSDLFG